MTEESDVDVETLSIAENENEYQRDNDNLERRAADIIENKFGQHKLRYNLVGNIREEHNENIYSIQIYQPDKIDPEQIIFATVGSNMVSVYEYTTTNDNIEIVDSYIDANLNESYYACAWTTDAKNQEPNLCFGGINGIIRVVVPFKRRFKTALTGHGSAINDLRFHPTRSAILLSASRDYTLRLWNVNTRVCIAIFGGVEGHRDEALSADINLTGTYIMSCSIDHFLKMWNLKSPRIVKAMKDSEDFDPTTRTFPTVLINSPDFSTRDVHTNYIDCVRWLGEGLVVSKSCENAVTFWKPGHLNDDINAMTRENTNVSILHVLPIKECDIWYVRFGLDYSQRILALGTTTGKIYVWDLKCDDPTNIKKTILVHPVKSKKTIRATAVSLNGQHILGANNEGEIFIWRKER